MANGDKIVQEVSSEQIKQDSDEILDEYEVKMNDFIIPFDEKKFFLDLINTFAKIKEADKDFIEREFNAFKAGNLTFALNTHLILGNMTCEDDMLKACGAEEINDKYTKDGIEPILMAADENYDLFQAVGKNIREFSRRSKFDSFKIDDDVMRQYSPKEFNDILLSYFATFGDRYYQIAKKYIEEHRICYNAKLINDALAYYLSFNWLNSGYIFTSLNALDSVTLSNIAHEIGHALDSELFVFPQKRKFINFSDYMIETPSIPFEIGMYDYLKSQNIDYNGGLVLSNRRTSMLIYHLMENRKALQDPNLLIYDNGAAKDSHGGTYHFRDNIVYGLGYLFGYHFSEIMKNSPQEFAKVWYDITTQRFESSLEESIKMTGFDLDGFVDLRYIKPRITKETMELKRKYRQQ